MIIIIYCLLLLGIGFYCRGEARSSMGYFLAGRSLGGGAIGLSLAATAFGGSAILITSQYVYTKGLAGVWFSLAVALGFAVLGFFFARRIRSSGAHSLADYMGRLYGRRVLRLVSILIVLVEISFFGLTVKSFALLATPLLGGGAWGGFSYLAHSAPLLQTAICAVFVGYTLLGGQKADVITDIVRLTVVGIILLLILLPVTLRRVDFAALPAGFLSFPFSPGAGPLFMLNMLVLMGLPGIVGGDVFAKVLSARDGAAARRGMLLAAFVRGLLALAVAALALGARARLPGLTHPEQAIPLLARELLPGALFQLISIVFLSALLSTGDSVLLTASTVLSLDVLRLGEEGAISRMRLVTLVVAVAGLALALWFDQVLEVMRFGYTLLTAGVIVPVLVPLLFGERRRPGDSAALAAILSGLAGALAWQFFRARLAPLAGLDPATVGVACSGVIMLLSPRRREA